MVKVTLLRFLLTVAEPFAVAAPEEAVGGTDRPVATDNEGRAMVPASSITGSLRHHMQRYAEQTDGVPDDLAATVFGRVPRGGGGSDEKSAESSRLRIIGTELRLNGKPIQHEDLVRRRQTQIHRFRRAAESHTLRSALMIPGGASIEMFARLEEDGELDDQRRLALREAIGSWRPVLGWGRNIGMGRADLAGVWEGTLDLDRDEDLRKWLLGGGPDLHREVATKELPRRQGEGLDGGEPWRVYRFEIVDALHIAGDPDDSDKIEGNGKAGKHSGKKGGPEPSKAYGENGRRSSNEILLWKRDGQPVIEGSSLKGIFRSRAEYVLASLGVGTPDEHPLIQDLFGTPDQQGRLIFRSSLVRGAECEKRPHVAIDRVTGGARDRHLYTMEVAVGGHFDLVIDYAGDQLDDDVSGTNTGAEVAGALVDAVIRDLHEGLIGIGGHTSSGHGTVRLTDPATCPEPSCAHLQEVASRAGDRGRQRLEDREGAR